MGFKSYKYRKTHVQSYGANVPRELGISTIDALAMGVELEAEPKSPNEMEKRIAASTVAAKFDVVSKSDGSLSPCGLEFVSPPEPLEDVRERMVTMVKKLRHIVREDSRAGLHVHVNKDGFENLDHVVDFYALFCNMPEAVLAEYAGRTSALQAGGYAALAPTIRTLNDTLAEMRRGQRQGHSKAADFGGARTNWMCRPGDHHSAVCESGKGTLEVRIFASTMDLDKLAQRIEFPAAAREFTRKLKGSELSYSKWLSWVEDLKSKYPALHEFHRTNSNISVLRNIGFERPKGSEPSPAPAGPPVWYDYNDSRWPGTPPLPDRHPASTLLSWYWDSTNLRFDAAATATLRQLSHAYTPREFPPENPIVAGACRIFVLGTWTTEQVVLRVRNFLATRPRGAQLLDPRTRPSMPTGHVWYITSIGAFGTYGERHLVNAGWRQLNTPEVTQVFQTIDAWGSTR